VTAAAAYIAPLLVDGDPVSAEALQEFFEAVEALDAATRVTAVRGACSASMNPSSASISQITGASVSFSTTGLHGFGLVYAVFDVQNTAAGTDFQGYVYIDGAANDALAIKYCGSADRQTLLHVIPTPLPPGAHTIDLRASKSVNVGTLTVNTTHTTVTVLVVDLP
jgi:hypothetical protein